MIHDEDKVQKTGHVYDGIEELDHPTPNWFQALFYVTVLFGMGYFIYYEAGEGPGLLEEYEKAKTAETIAVYEHESLQPKPPTLSESELASLVKDPAKIKSGAATFQARCSSCHGSQGEGGIGPNLTDSYWLHGGKMTDVFATITKGVLDKGMPPWGALLNTEEIQNVTVFVRTLLGTKPRGAKEPQGELAKAE